VPHPASPTPSVRSVPVREMPALPACCRLTPSAAPPILSRAESGAMQETKVDIAIIGAGIVGAACAWWCTRRGLKIAVIDAQAPAAGTSGACDGYVSISSKKPGVVMQLAARSKRLYPEVVADLARDVEYRTAGGLLLVEDPDTLPELEARAAGVRDFGFDMHYLDRAAML